MWVGLLLNITNMVNSIYYRPKYYVSNYLKLFYKVVSNYNYKVNH